MLNARKQPCADCPWRKDAPTGKFPPEAYQRLAASSYDMERTIFQCHETTDEVPLVCAGFLERGADHNLTIRLAYINGTLEHKDRSGGHELHECFKDMAIANGVDPDDVSLKSSRRNSD